MQLILAWTAKEDELDYTQAPRIKTEAVECYEPHKGKRMEKYAAPSITYLCEY